MAEPTPMGKEDQKQQWEKLEVLQLYQEIATKIDVKSKLREYNEFYEGKYGHLMLKEDTGVPVLEGVLKIYWGVKAPINLKKEQATWKRRGNSMIFDSGLEEKLMQAMGDATKRNRHLLRDSQIEINAEEDMGEETSEVEVGKDKNDIRKVKKETFQNKETAKGSVDVKTEKDMRREKQNLKFEKEFVSETDEVDKEKGAFRKEKQEVKSKKDVVHEVKESQSPSGIRKQLQTKKVTYSTSSTSTRSVNQNGAAFKDFDSLPRASGLRNPEFGSLRTRGIGESLLSAGSLRDRTNDLFSKQKSDFFNSRGDVFKTEKILTKDEPELGSKENLVRSKSMINQSRPKVQNIPSRAKSLQRRRKMSFSGHYYNKETAVFTPTHGSVTNVRVNSLMTAPEVIGSLLLKFAVENTPEEFMLCKVKETGETMHMKQTDFPLLERVNMGPSEEYAKIYIVEKTAVKDVTHEVTQYIHVDLPVLKAILTKIEEEEQKKITTIKKK
uniref:Uncharacterized protein LOC100366511 n=1 Tax=Saccoglossus kowalevskii TaxID=10224 RepID=A0ABM0GQF8_SACKO|nr:PREDICTED: uncharacterized protein LOC100366511 [Saccoglossus kowalevskii]